ncbi:hypothetical protein F4W05_13195 [Ewingella americana]|uniref:Uncharacterized protein n=1 Tax=Ewingella americana TaxID=41202 RepID=A0A377N5P6_9GAMM|nr:hypothetical protein [Ewingella americana]KAA8727571.1 hypothetical protein F4W05_13195 [Ewingella americana]STQ42851.1 Uncharacterised protein [Ewingella americana]
MKMIMVEKAGLKEDFIAWNVAPSYASMFLEKCQDVDGMVALSPYMFNDSMHLDNPHQLFAVNCAFWCRVYREAESSKEQNEALASIRATYYMANSLGQGSITVLITRWWDAAKPLHGLHSLNVSPVARHKTALTHIH